MEKTTTFRGMLSPAPSIPVPVNPKAFTESVSALNRLNPGQI